MNKFSLLPEQKISEISIYLVGFLLHPKFRKVASSKKFTFRAIGAMALRN